MYFKLLSLFVLLCGLQSCGTSMESDPYPVCPPNTFKDCEIGVSKTKCSFDGEILDVCAVDAGILSNSCPKCTPGVCAIDKDQITCCIFGCDQ